MNGKEQIFKMLEGKIETMQTLAVECIELIYNAGYNEAIEAAALKVPKYEDDNMNDIREAIRQLKK